jgi:AcrR family transcriptional regulator
MGGDVRQSSGRARTVAAAYPRLRTAQDNRQRSPARPSDVGPVASREAIGGTRKVSPLYRRLPRGPSDMTREQIARNQRARLCGGMIESVAKRGYQATTVADVISLAGVSRRAFYEHFRDKEECLSATHNGVVSHARMRAIEAWGSQHGWANRLHAACKSLFDEVLEHPNGMRLVLVNSLGINPRARERMGLANLAFERLLSLALRANLRGPDLPLIPPCAIVGGVRQAVFARVREHRESELHTLADEVLDWVESYRLPRERSLALPQGCGINAQTPAAFLTRRDPRARILAATVQLTYESGYLNLTDSRLARSARLPTQALHREFPSKEACLIAVLDAFIEETLELVHAEMRQDLPWPTEIHHAMKAYVAYLASNQALARLAFVDLFDVGPGIIGHLTRSVDELIKLLTGAGPAPSRGPLVAREAITGAIWAIVFNHIVGGRASQLSALGDQLTFVVLAPYIGAKAAMGHVGVS